MKKYLILTALLFLMGCQQGTKLDDFQIGMPLSEAQSLTTLNKIRENQDFVEYRCKLETGVDSMIKYGSLFSGNEPYILTFDKRNGLLTEIVFDEITANIRKLK